MKRVAIVLAAGLLLALSACAREETQPETEVEPRATVQLFVAEQNWSGVMKLVGEPPEPDNWEEQSVRPGSIVTRESSITMGEGETLSWKLTVLEVADRSVTVRFETQGVGTEEMDVTTDPPPEKHAWTAAVPFDDVYMITTLTMGAGTTWKLKFMQYR